MEKKILFIYQFFKLVRVKYTVVNVLFLVLREGKYVVKYNMCIHVPVSYLKYRKSIPFLLEVKVTIFDVIIILVKLE